LEKVLEESSHIPDSSTVTSFVFNDTGILHPSNVRSLWDEFVAAMSEDFQSGRHASASHPVVILMNLKDIDSYLRSYSKSLDYPDASTSRVQTRRRCRLPGQAVS
jgi:hypothetical protein